MDGNKTWLRGGRFWALVAGALALRYLCHAVMLLPVLAHEAVPAPTLRDLVLLHVPYMPMVARWNYVIWLLCYLPPALWVGCRDRRLFLRLVLTDGVLALARGVMVPLTGLGPVRGTDLNALHPFNLEATWLAVLNPIRAIAGDSAGIYLTKDLFFSGHIATTFLLYLFARRLGRVRWLFLALNLLTLAVVLLAHMHYTIDIISAYAITFCIYRAGESLVERQYRRAAAFADSLRSR